MNISCVLSSVHNCHAVTTFPFTTKLSWGTILPSAREITPIKTYVIAVIIWKKSKAMEEGSGTMCNLRDGQGSNFHTLFGMQLSFLTFIY
jgi:hypothetical protein